MKIRSILCMVCMLFSFGANAQDELSEGMETLISWMTGSFDSAEQAAEDTSYYDISLKMTRIWHDKPNGVWLYVEQALAATPDEPYRQRVYFVSELDEDNFLSDVYLIKDEEKYIGAWKDPSMFSGLTPFDIQHKSGCTVFLFYDGFSFSGSTNEDSCPSELRGATYATSEVIITGTEVKSWDRGYDAEGTQVWGAENGHYIFSKGL